MKSINELPMSGEIQSPAPLDPNGPAPQGSRNSPKADLLGRSRDDLRAWLTEIGEPAYRGSQLYHALYAERRFDFARDEQRTRNASAAPCPRFPHRLAGNCAALSFERRLGALSAESSPIQAAGGTGVMLRARIEAVFMPSPGRQTVCISTQAGCAVDCHFCLTAQLGLVRNLSAGEIVAQVLLALEDHRESLAPRTNVVLMGQGEPLLNYEPVMAAMRIMLDPNGMALAPRHVTLSTSGIVPGIERLAAGKDSAEAGNLA